MEEGKTAITWRIDNRLLAKVRKLAKEEKRSLNAQVAVLLIAALEQKR